MFERITPVWQDRYGEDGKIRNGDYKSANPTEWPKNFDEGYEQCDFHRLTGWGNRLRMNQQRLDSNPENGGGLK